MRVGDGHAQSIGRVLPGQHRQLQQTLDHFLDLRFGGATVPGDRLLHLQSGVFGHRQVTRHQSRDRTAPGLAQQQGRLRVDVDKHDLDRSHIGLVTRGDFTHTVVDDFQSGRQVAHLTACGLDHAAGHVLQARAGDVDHTKARGLQAGIDPQNANAGWRRGAQAHGNTTSFIRAMMVSARRVR